MGMIKDTEPVLRIPYDVGAFEEHTQMIRNAKVGFLEMEDVQRKKLGPMLDVLLRGMYMLVKDVYRYGGSLPSGGREHFSIVQDGLEMTAYSFFNFRNGRYEEFDDVYSVIANEKLALDVHVPCRGTLFLLNAFNIINNLKGNEKDKAIELGDIVLRGMYHASESIYNPETDPQFVIGSGSNSDFPTDRNQVLPKLVESFKS